MLTDLAPPVAAAAQVEGVAAQLGLPTGYADEPAGRARLAALIDAAVCHIEQRVSRALINRNFRLTLPAWPDDRFAPLPLAPLRQLVSLAVVGSDGTWTAAPSDSTRLDMLGEVPGVRAAPGYRFPPIPTGGHAEIVFEAGYGPDWADVPADLRLAVTLLAAALHDAGAEAAQSTMPFGVVALTEPYRQVRL